MRLRELFGIKGLTGWCIAGVCAVMITSASVMFYNYSGTHIVNPSGATDYKWLPGQYKGNMTEGINLMHMDENGFNNLSADTENIDILLMGGSHMEAVQFPTEYNTGTLLNDACRTEKPTISVCQGISCPPVWIIWRRLQTSMRHRNM